MYLSGKVKAVMRPTVISVIQICLLQEHQVLLLNIFNVKSAALKLELRALNNYKMLPPNTA